MTELHHEYMTYLFRICTERLFLAPFIALSSSKLPLFECYAVFSENYDNANDQKFLQMSKFNSAHDELSEHVQYTTVALLEA